MNFFIKIITLLRIFEPVCIIIAKIISRFIRLFAAASEIGKYKLPFLSIT